MIRLNPRFQKLAYKKDQKNIAEAIKYLEKANKISEKLVEIDPEEYDLFIPYVYATLCYMKNDLQGLSKYLNILENADTKDMLYPNVVKIRQLYKGLTTFKSLNYTRDY